VQADVALAHEHRLTLEDRVELPRIYMAWHSPAMFASDDAEMDLLADLLATGKTSRLYRTLVYDRRIAVDVSAYQSSREIGSFFLLAVTAAPGHPLSDVASVIDKELQAVVDEGPTDAELERSMAQAEAHFVYRLQTVGGFGGKSDQLNAYNVLRRDPAYFVEDLGRYRAATRQTVRAAAKTYLRFDRRVVLGVVPRGQPSLSVPGAEPVSVS
jgi:zinc protease